MNDNIKNLIEKYPALEICKQDIEQAYEILRESFCSGHKLLVCGNGGSASDSEHIVGELMKGFILPRIASSKALGDKRLQYALPAISLVSQCALISAIANDNGYDMVFAQQVMGYGQKGDTIIGLSTSGNAEDVINAVLLANEKGLKTIGMTGKSGGKLGNLCDTCIKVPREETSAIQEFHLPIYHCLCMMLEKYFFS
ncbi:MAG: SIS domain-containing protein [Sphaerochaetaceae bacterium]